MKMPGNCCSFKIFSIPAFVLILFSSLPVFAYTQALTHVGGAPAKAEVVLVTDDNKVIMAGAARLNGNAFGAVVRYLANGSLDSSFGHKGVARIDPLGKEYLYGLTANETGAVYVSGYSQRWFHKDVLLVKLDTQGKPDPQFGKNGFVVDDFGGDEEIHYMARDSQGRLVLAGFSEDGDGTHPLVVRYLPDGKRDPAFVGARQAAPQIKGAASSAPTILYSLVLDSQDRPVVAGAIQDDRGITYCIVARFTSQGNLDASFGNEGIVWANEEGVSGVCSSVTVSKKGGIFAAGYQQMGLNNTAFFATSLNKNGTKNLAFGQKGIVLTDITPGFDLAHGIVIDSNENIFLAGEYQTGQDERGKFYFGMALVQYDAHGIPDPSFYEKGVFKMSLSSRDISGFMGVTLDSDEKPVMAGVSKKRFLLLRNP
ncbi:MAG TPA: hypothetical protein DDW49_05135 [Deltaproteobacteria bacterium]|nr:MAG: hypothetical protein A2048_04385 [Deltaproteobacteria bacterium GWA2_45_12]HBF12760.1 hypothetical protein [Deltaproteobacteria bacterium]